MIARWSGFGEIRLRRVLDQYLEHYHAERTHQGIGNELIVPTHSTGSLTSEIVETERLGGLLRSYQRTAA